MHAEVNAIVNAARLGVSPIGATLYLTCEIPCKDCFGVIINAGIAEVVVAKLERYDYLSGWMLTTGRHTLRVRDYLQTQNVLS